MEDEKTGATLPVNTASSAVEGTRLEMNTQPELSRTTSDCLLHFVVFVLCFVVQEQPTYACAGNALERWNSLHHK